MRTETYLLFAGANNNSRIFTKEEQMLYKGLLLKTDVILIFIYEMVYTSPAVFNCIHEETFRFSTT